jgi:ankyrin repeat protein
VLQVEKVCRETNNAGLLESQLQQQQQQQATGGGWSFKDVRFSDGWTPLQVCCSKGFVESAEFLLQRGGVDVEAVVEADGSNAFHKACKQGNVAVITLLIKHNANVNAATKSGNTPLHYACWDRKSGAVVLLLDSGADIQRANVDGYPPLLAAAFHGQAKIVQLRRFEFLYESPIYLRKFLRGCR